jgi:hypothetical protein
MVKPYNVGKVRHCPRDGVGIVELVGAIDSTIARPVCLVFNNFFLCLKRNACVGLVNSRP